MTHVFSAVQQERCFSENEGPTWIVRKSMSFLRAPIYGVVVLFRLKSSNVILWACKCLPTVWFLATVLPLYIHWFSRGAVNTAWDGSQVPFRVRVITGRALRTVLVGEVLGRMVAFLAPDIARTYRMWRQFL